MPLSWIRKLNSLGMFTDSSVIFNTKFIFLLSLNLIRFRCWRETKSCLNFKKWRLFWNKFWVEFWIPYENLEFSDELKEQVWSLHCHLHLLILELILSKFCFHFVVGWTFFNLVKKSNKQRRRYAWWWLIYRSSISLQ